MLSISWSTQSTETDAQGNLAARSAEHTLRFDCVTSETHEGISELTSHAVESGAPISSHKRANPDRISIEAIVSNTPMDVPPPSGYAPEGSPITTNMSKGPPDAQGSERASVLVFSADFDRMADVEFTLRRLRLEATSVTLSTRLRTYEDVQIIGVTIPRTPEDGDSIRIQLEIQQVRIAQSRTVDAPRPREPRGTQRADRGGQEAGEATAGQRQSALSSLSELAGDSEAGRRFMSALGG